MTPFGCGQEVLVEPPCRNGDEQARPWMASSKPPELAGGAASWPRSSGIRASFGTTASSHPRWFGGPIRLEYLTDRLGAGMLAEYAVFNRSVSSAAMNKVTKDAPVTVKGRVRTRRDSRAGILFVQVSDGSSFQPVQPRQARHGPGDRTIDRVDNSTWAVGPIRRRMHDPYRGILATGRWRQLGTCLPACATIGYSKTAAPFSLKNRH